MVAGFMIFIFALMFFVLGASAYSAISKLRRKVSQSRWLQRKPDPEDPQGEREEPAVMGLRTSLFPREMA